jgi:hypothetical protein
MSHSGGPNLKKSRNFLKPYLMQNLYKGILGSERIAPNCRCFIPGDTALVFIGWATW